MMFKKNAILKIILLLVFSDILETFSQFCFKKSALLSGPFQIKAFSDAVTFAKTSALSPFLWVALISVFLTFIIWATVLSKVDLSVAHPIASFSYILVPLVSIVFFHEKIAALGWVGIIFILIGAIFVSLSSKEKEDIL